MKTRPVLALILVSMLVLGCSSTQKVVLVNAEIDQMMAQKAFEITITSAEPMLTQAMVQVANSGILAPGNTVSRIDLGGDGYFITVKGDSVSANLPYYGERQMGGGYGSENGIVFDGITQDLRIEKDAVKQNYELNFSIAAGSESLFIHILVGNKGTSSTTVRSSQRNRIRYAGGIKKLKEDLTIVIK